MIRKDCFTPEWVDNLSERYNYRDKNLIEKVIHAFSLLELLSSNGCHRTFIRHALEGCRDFYRPGYGYKKAGVVITRLVQEEGFSHSLFSDMAALEKESKLSSSIDSIHKLFGRGAVLLGSQGNGEIKMSRDHQSPHYTTLWSDIPKASVR